PTKLPGLAGHLKVFRVETGDASAKRLGLDHVVDRAELATYLVRREEEKPAPLLYAPGVRGEHPAPIAAALDDPGMAWGHALGEIWPAPRIRERPDRKSTRLNSSH